MNMSEEEKEYIIEQVEELIRVSIAAGKLAHGSDREYTQAMMKVCKQKRLILSMDGIEGDY